MQWVWIVTDSSPLTSPPPTTTPSIGTITRSFSATNVVPGGTIIATLTPLPASLFTNPGYQVIETVPAGFTVTSNTAGLATHGGNVWTFIQIGSAPITFTLTVPSTTSTGIFSGTFKDQYRNTGIISGNTTITIGGINYDSNNNGRIDRSEAIQAVIDFFSGAITRQQAIDAVVAFFNPDTPTLTPPSIVPTPTPSPPPTPAPVGNLNPLTSQVFQNGGYIPTQYTCSPGGTYGCGVSPSLSWGLPPAGTISLALILDDPDAGDFTHWVYYNIPASMRSLPEGVEKIERPASGGIQGTNDFGTIGYGGPCPPSGTHTYRFILYALDSQLNPGSPTRQGVLNAMQGHVLAEAQLDGEYGI
jgi:Raf kinase inhibitor-like YbhB/YbcL family protein